MNPLMQRYSNASKEHQHSHQAELGNWGYIYANVMPYVSATQALYRRYYSYFLS